MIKKISDMILTINSCPELFHDGIDEEIVDLLKSIIIYLEKEGGE